MQRVRKQRRQSSSLNRSLILQSSSGVKQMKKILSKNAKILNLSQIDAYRRSTKLELSEQTIQNIKTTLELEGVVQKNYAERKQHDDLYFNYEKNPFLLRDNLQEEEVNAENVRRNENQQKQDGVKKRPSKIKEPTLVSALNNIKSKLTTTNFSYLKPTKLGVEMEISRTERANRDKALSKTKYLKADKLKVKKAELIREMSPLIVRQNSAEKVAESLVQLDNIVGMVEKNFYQQQMQKKDINLFNILYLKRDQALAQYGSGMLSRFSFCLNSIIKVSTHKQSIDFGDISSERRKVVLDPKKKPKIDPTEKTEFIFDYHKVSFEEMIGVASGKLTPEMLRQMKAGQKPVGEDDDSLVNPSLIVYRMNTKNKLVANDLRAVNTSEIVYFKYQPYTKIQNVQQQLSEDCKRRLQKILKGEQICRRNTINDLNTYKKLNKEKDEVINKQLQTDAHMIKTSDIERKIRMNKTQKDRCESIKTKLVLSSLICKKVYQNSWKSRSKSPNKMSFWR